MSGTHHQCGVMSDVVLRYFKGPWVREFSWGRAGGLGASPACCPLPGLTRSAPPSVTFGLWVSLYKEGILWPRLCRAPKSPKSLESPVWSSPRNEVTSLCEVCAGGRAGPQRSSPGGPAGGTGTQDGCSPGTTWSLPVWWGRSHCSAPWLFIFY